MRVAADRAPFTSGSRSHVAVLENCR